MSDIAVLGCWQFYARWRPREDGAGGVDVLPLDHTEDRPSRLSVPAGVVRAVRVGFGFGASVAPGVEARAGRAVHAESTATIWVGEGAWAQFSLFPIDPVADLVWLPVSLPAHDLASVACSLRIPSLRIDGPAVSRPRPGAGCLAHLVSVSVEAWGRPLSGLEAAILRDGSGGDDASRKEQRP
jgi:hypothetical protein